MATLIIKGKSIEASPEQISEHEAAVKWFYSELAQIELAQIPESTEKPLLDGPDGLPYKELREKFSAKIAAIFSNE
jgi:hypothetical protein